MIQIIHGYFGVTSVTSVVLLWLRPPVNIPHHEVLELGRDSPVETGPRQQPLRLPVLHPLSLVARLPLQVRVAQGDADVVEEAGQRTQLDDGILRLQKREPGLYCRFILINMVSLTPPPPLTWRCTTAWLRDLKPHLQKQFEVRHSWWILLKFNPGV